MDYSGSTFQKPQKKEKPKKGLKSRTPLKAHYEPIDKKLKEEVIQVKGNLCFMGFCPNCQEGTTVDIYDDFHHFPHKSRGGQDCVLDLWPSARMCHEFIQTHPWEEKEMFRQIEAAGIPVRWKAARKGIGAVS